MTVATANLFPDGPSPWAHLLPRKTAVQSEGVPVTVWDIPYTIPQLSYATHGHFRYYGKFPSAVAAQILEDNPSPHPQAYVLDNFCGSGTTLVEARLRGINSVGIDVSWLAILASKVKTSPADASKVNEIVRQVLAGATRPVEPTPLTTKWFDPVVTDDLSALREELLCIPHSDERDFAILALLGIVRRVSRAHDAEVRPHIKKGKAPRDVRQAYTKKIRDMLSAHAVFTANADVGAFCNTRIQDNRKLTTQHEDGRDCYLVISHPPYLNSFDYSPVFNMEYWWGAPFAPEGLSKDTAKQSEMKAYPASEPITTGYYQHLSECYSETFRIQKPGGKLAVIIGDCTRNRVLEPVIENSISLIEKIGYRLTERNYRTTHYGLGKYAYDFRADYHGDAEKRDGIFIFEKP